MRRLTYCVMLLALGLLGGCANKKTIAEQQDWIQPSVLSYVEKLGYDRDEVEVLKNSRNSKWVNYWQGLEDEMTPRARLWHDQIHTLWVYHILPVTQDNLPTLWVFVDRDTEEIKGHMPVH